MTADLQVQRTTFPPALPIVLSATAGYVDTAGFLALQGLFTAHVTGNFVTLGASLVTGTSGAVAKLLALPVFCLVVIGARLGGAALRTRGKPALPVMLSAQLALLVVGWGLAMTLGPFRSGDTWRAIITGMVLVAAMAIQNAAHRVHLGSAPPSTLMTGTTTQLMLDTADWIRGQRDGRIGLLARMRSSAASLGAFAGGCGAAALAFAVVLVGSCGAWNGTIRTNRALAPARRIIAASQVETPEKI